MESREPSLPLSLGPPTLTRFSPHQTSSLLRNLGSWPPTLFSSCHISSLHIPSIGDLSEKADTLGSGSGGPDILCKCFSRAFPSTPHLGLPGPSSCHGGFQSRGQLWECVIVTGQEVVSREIQRSMEVCEAWPGLWLLRERARGRAA